MAKVTIKDGFGDYSRRLLRASEAGMDAGAFVVKERVKVDISRLGRSPSGRRQNVDFTDFLERAEGLVDPPGGTPRVRTGLLRRSITVERTKPGLRRIGPAAGLVYPGGTPVGVVARAHELGATINHPGGTPYIIVSGRDGAPRAVFLKKTSTYKHGKKAKRQRGASRIKRALARGSVVKFTKPHTIRIPKRPFLRPALHNSRVQWVRAYEETVMRQMARVRDTTGGGV